jgi:Ca2+-binding RTX toxin-like protein
MQGNDTVDAGGGDDWVHDTEDDGNDTISSVDGNDHIIQGGPGNDVSLGGPGLDQSLSGGPENDNRGRPRAGRGGG